MPLLCTTRFAETHRERIAADHPDLELVTVTPGTDDDVDLTSVDIAYTPTDVYPDRIDAFLAIAQQAPNLRWLQMFSAGLDYAGLQPLRERGVRITSASGATASAISRTVMLYLLGLSRDIRGLLADQAAHHWRSPRPYDDIADKRIGVVGTGPIGLEIIRMSAALGMRPIGMRRAVRGDEPCETWALDRFAELARTVDVLVLALPLTASTHGICSAEVLASMKPNAVIVNVGRGALIDEPALAAALASGALGGAGLDVFTTEPLPAASPLWDLPNVIISPHSSAATAATVDAINEIFFANLAAFRRGGALVNEEG